MCYLAEKHGITMHAMTNVQKSIGQKAIIVHVTVSGKLQQLSHYDKRVLVQNISNFLLTIILYNT
jgi:hypothetical protein